MSRIELKITHSNNKRTLGNYRITSDQDVFTIGSSSNARIRVKNESVDDIHASIESRDGTWTIIDLASKNGTWIGKDPISEASLDRKVSLVFGDDTLTIEPVEIKPYDLFTGNNKLAFTPNSKSVQKQQVVVMFGKEILRTGLTEVGQEIGFHFDGRRHMFKAATNSDWVEDTVAGYTVKRRIVRTEVHENEKPKNILGYLPKEMVDAFGVALGITLLFFLTAWLMPKLMPKDPGALEKNKYTRMLIDEEFIKQQQKEAVKLQKKLEKKEKKEEKKTVVKKDPPKMKKPVAMPETAQAKKVINEIKDSGLSKQIANIASSANINTKSLLEGAGKGIGNSRNRSFASAGVAVKGATLSKNAGAYNVTAVATNGVAGGTAVSGKLGGLSAGGVGAGGLVDAIEEETEISGGLDPAIISKVVKDNIGRVRYCYERQLAAEPNLYGKIKVTWTITAAGSVSVQKIDQSTMKNSMVEGCILRTVSKWNFPRPDGGGDVVVSYPFFFKANK